MAEWTPYVPPTQSPAEFTAKAIVLGVLFGLLFGASTVYLGLRAGLTVSASIPIAVLAISVLKKFGGSTILENNIVQTIGSAGESVAGGVVFTIPALIFLLPYGPDYFTYVRITMLTLAGGILGVLMMVPLRRALIVKEHGVLPYPEGTACAKVLVAGERGGRLAALVFGGLGIGVLWKSLSWVFNLFRTEIGYVMPRTSQFPNATLAVDISPEYLGVGYVIGPRIAGTMVAGGVLAWLGLLPLLTILGQFMTEPFPPIHPNFAVNPATGRPFLISEMDPGQLWSAYIRYIGAGAVLAAGIITLARTIPTIVSSARGSLRDITASAGGGGHLRTERDIPMSFVLGGSVLARVEERWHELLFIGALVYTIVAGLSHAAEATARAARAEAAAAQTQLAALRAQLQPHFLFNALHTVVQLIPVEPQRAAEAAELVADLLRTTLEEQRDEVTLDDEWRFVSRYLTLERIRFGDRLVVRSELADELLDERVPAYALQTLVENAVRHGAAPRVAPTEIVVSAAGDGAELTLAVRNTGDGPAPQPAVNGAGTGLERLRKRLAVLHGGAARLACGPTADGGWEAVRVLPRARRRAA